MSENTPSQIERTSKDSITFPYTLNNDFSASKSGGYRIRFKAVRSDILYREFLKENSPKPENNTTKISVTSTSSTTTHRESKEKPNDSICDEDDSSTNILNKTLIEEDSVVTETKDIMPGFAWLDKTPEIKTIKRENKLGDVSPSELFGKLSIKDDANAKKIESKTTNCVYQGLSEYLFKVPNYKMLTTVASSQCRIPKSQYTTPNYNDSIISSSNPLLLSAKKKHLETTPKRETPQIQINNGKYQDTPRNIPQNSRPNQNIILREKNMNIEMKTPKIEPPKQPEKQKTIATETPKNDVKPTGPQQNKQIVPPQTIVKQPEPTTFKTIKIRNKNYILINKLGEGGSGQVFRCLEQETLQDRAVKVVNLAVDAHTAASYINEVKMLKDLQGSDRVIKMYDYEQQNQKLFVVMEKGDVDFSVFLRNITTDCQVQRHIIICYWVEMLKCVKEIHKNGIIHSDLKPSNFLLVGGRLKLIDFGIASKMSGDMTSVIKSEQVGSFNYISPEALLDSRECPTEGKPRIRISYKSDVWSLGCILYQMVYKKTPFHNFTTLMTKAFTIIDKNHRIDYPVVEGVPMQLIDMIKKCLTYEMKNRPSVEELLDMYYTGNY